MLVLSRKLNESIVISNNIRITVVGIRGNQIRLGIEAPDSIKIFREEILDIDHELAVPVGHGHSGGVTIAR